MQNHTIYILSGPAGAGKTTLWNAVESEATHIKKVVTSTSRAAREGEIDGIHYHFLTKPEFESRIHTNDLIEYAIVHTNYYGSTYSELERILQEDRSPIYIIEPQGMIHLKPLLEKQGYRVVTIFLLPPSLEVLKQRLMGRWTETAEQFEIRLATALTELEQQDFYDIKITNDDLDIAREELLTIFRRKYVI